MSKMDRMLNSKREKQTIYEIYRACRLCGAGAGYKMPIIQNVVDLDDTDVELKQKIRECVQIEVHQDDKMPPLICELCVDKVNDFYEFLDMCRQTNKRTRLRLGLPPQSMPRGAPDAEDCILGLTEPVYVNEDSDGEPLAKHKRSQLKVKVKKEPELKVKLESKLPAERLERSSRLKSRRSPTPPRVTRHSKGSRDDSESLTRLQDKSKSSKVTPVKSILKKDKKPEEVPTTPRLKRTRDKEPVKLETSTKKVKIAVKPISPKSSPKTSPRSKVAKPAKTQKRPPSPPPRYRCAVCDVANKTPQAVASHMRVHVVNYTNPKLACNPCEVWFSTAEEASSHHKHHRSRCKPYHCRRCDTDFRLLTAYDDHLQNECVPWEEVPDVKCDVCWHLFATDNLLQDHKCLGEDHRPGGKCGKCKRTYALLKNLRKHEANCTAKKKGELVLDPELLSKLRPMQVRVSRCDPLLANIKQEHYDVSSVTPDFGLDKNCVYPYISSFSGLRIKSDPDRLDGMVAIGDEIKHELLAEEDYVHWDSEDSDSDEDVSFNLVLNPFARKRKVDTLATLTLKTIFSQRCLGRVPRKRRRVKAEKNVFDSLLADEDDVTRDINNIIDNLGDDDDINDNVGDGSELSKENDVVINDKSIEINDSKESNENVELSDKSAEVSDVREDGDDNKTVDDVDASNDVNMGDDNDNANKSAEKTEQSVQNDVNLSQSNVFADKNEESKDVNEENDHNDSSKDVNDEKDINGAANDDDDGVNDNKTKCNDDSGSNNDLSSQDKDNNDDFKVNNGTVDNKNDKKNSEDSLSAESDTNVVDDHSKPEKVTRIGNDENENESGIIDDELSSRIDEKSIDIPENEQEPKNTIDNNQDSNSMGAYNDSLLNDTTQSDDNDIHEQNNSEIDENKSQDDISIDNLSQDSKLESELLNTDSDSNQKTLEDKTGQSEGEEVTNESVIKSVIVNSEKSQNTVTPDDMDDSKLLEALDAQIGDSNDSADRQTDNFNDKIALEDLITTKNTEKSMDLDIIPDEFNFDT